MELKPVTADRRMILTIENRYEQELLRGVSRPSVLATAISGAMPAGYHNLHDRICETSLGLIIGDRQDVIVTSRQARRMASRILKQVNEVSEIEARRINKAAYPLIEFAAQA